MNSKEITTTPIFDRLLYYTLKNGSAKNLMETSKIMHNEVMKPENKAKIYGYSLKLAIKYNDLPVIRWLNKHGYNKNDFYLIDEAAIYGHLELIQFFHKCKVVCGRRAINNAAENGHLDVIIWLHENVNATCTEYAMNIAAKRGYYEIVKWLHENRKEGCTYHAFDDAILYGHFEILKFLTNVRLCDIWSYYSMKCAIRSGKIEIVKYVFDEGKKQRRERKRENYVYFHNIDYYNDFMSIAKNMNQVEIIIFLAENKKEFLY